MKKEKITSLIVLFVALAALIVAALSLNKSLNLLVKEDDIYEE